MFRDFLSFSFEGLVNRADNQLTTQKWNEYPANDAFQREAEDADWFISCFSQSLVRPSVVRNQAAWVISSAEDYDELVSERTSSSSMYTAGDD